MSTSNSGTHRREIGRVRAWWSMIVTTCPRLISEGSSRTISSSSARLITFQPYWSLWSITPLSWYCIWFVSCTVSYRTNLRIIGGPRYEEATPTWSTWNPHSVMLRRSGGALLRILFMSSCWRGSSRIHPYRILGSCQSCVSSRRTLRVWSSPWSCWMKAIWSTSTTDRVRS